MIACAIMIKVQVRAAWPDKLTDLKRRKRETATERASESEGGWASQRTFSTAHLHMYYVCVCVCLFVSCEIN